MKRRVVSFLSLAVALSSVAFMGVAHASSVNNVAVSYVDSRTKEDTKVRVSVDDPTNSRNYTFKLSENGEDRTAQQVIGINDSINNQITKRRTVIVVDSSITLARDGRFDQEKSAVKAFIDSMPGGDRDSVTVVGAGSIVSHFGDFTSNKDELKSDVDALTVSSGRSINGAMSLAIDQLRDVDGDVKNIVLFAAGPATDAANPASEILDGRMLSNNILTYVAGVDIKDAPDPKSNQIFVQNGRGAYREVNADTPAVAVGTDISGAVANQWILHYHSRATGVIRLEVEAGGKTAKATTNVGVISAGADLNAKFTKPAAWLSKIPTLNATTARLIVSLLVLVGTALFVWVMYQIVDRRSSLEQALRPYADRKIDPDEDSDLHMETALMRRALEVTEDIARERGFLNKVENKLYQADLGINAAEFIFLSFAVVIILAIAGFAIKGTMGSLIMLFLGGFGVPSFLNFKAGRRKRLFEKQLPDSLQLLGGSLRAGYSLLQGLDATAQQVDDPLGKELRQALAEARLGRPIEDALGDMAARVQSVDFAWTVMAIKIQRDVGGNLAEVLDNVAKTMIERERLRREINSLTAEGKLSAVVLSILPPGLSVYLWITNPDYINILFKDTLGRMLFFGGLAGMAGGIYWMKTMLNLDL